MSPALALTETAETTETDELATDDTLDTWCDEHRDAWIADLDNTDTDR
jgi:hypothetical protein